MRTLKTLDEYRRAADFVKISVMRRDYASAKEVLQRMIDGIGESDLDECDKERLLDGFEFNKNCLDRDCEKFRELTIVISHLKGMGW